MRAAALIPLALAACAPVTPPPVVAENKPVEQAGSGKCDASQLGHAVGRRLDPALTMKLMTESGARTSRVIRPGTAVTMDYREDRLNFEVDTEGRITAIRCG